MDKISLDKRSLRKFGVTMGIAFFVISALIFVKHRHGFTPGLAVSGVFFAVGLFTPHLLRPVYISWMKFAYVLGWVNTRIILLLVFFLIFTPIGLVLKLLGKDLLDRKIEKDKETYWHQKDKQAFDPRSFERLF